MEQTTIIITIEEYKRFLKTEKELELLKKTISIIGGYETEKYIKPLFLENEKGGE